MMRTACAVARLYCIHLFAFIAITLSTYFPGWDLFLSGVYLAVVSLEGRVQSGFSGGQKCLIAAAWQGPALFLAFYIVRGWIFWNLSDYAIFVLQFWTAPLLPLWSLIRVRALGQYPCYYYLILITPLLLGLWYIISSRAGNKKSADDF